MKYRLKLTALALALLLAGGGVSAQEAKVPVKEHQLANGMSLLMVQRSETPVVTVGWVAHVGSANESYGLTGMAHLFEHMMFKGTKTVGTKDWAVEKEIMAKLDAVRAEMDVEYSKLREAKRRGEVTGNIYLPENETPRLGELRAHMQELQKEQATLIVKDEIDQLYTEQGASGLNAGTFNDMTVYFVTLPANKLELWFWMESERLLNPVFREFYSERDVVREERRSRVESSPTGLHDEQFDAMFWSGTPYHHPVIGWPSDVESIGRAEADRFFATYYAPNNITAVLVGDLDPEQVLELAERYFGRIPRGEVAPADVVTEGMRQVQPRRMHAEADTNPTVQVRWHTVPFVHRDRYALDLLAGVLSSRTGRLYKALVEDQGVATGEPYVSSQHLKYGGSFELGAEVAEGKRHDEVEAALLAEIERLKQEPVGERELQKVKNQTLANSFRRLQSRFFLALQLLIYEGWGDWHFLNEAPALARAVSAEDLLRVAETYLVADGRNILWYSRKAGTEEDPRLAALPAEQQGQIKQMLGMIRQETDAGKLEQMLSMMQAQSAMVPADQKAGFELMVEEIGKHLASLKAAGEEE